ncbi:hypothetical protein SUGI_0324640 [Cryptomeria japonica]|uniref:VQ motif-containing protein 11 n=1 Tax=Cryptomeria japonica TaxID=3369 RepID=UPI002408C536|nr:VQ motif-containing protein 11 [Cryptomeria japonica]GLJ18341.1 hypothetical protein SUGI_0324640 [Cryptomeria japonica]
MKNIMAKSQSIAQGSKQSGSANSECTTSYKQTIIYTTFLETESHSFKELVQKHTGVSEGEKLPVTMPPKKSSRGSAVAGLKSDGGFALIKGGIEVGPQKSAFKLHHRRQFHKRLEMQLGLGHDDASAPKLVAGNGCVLSPTLNPSPCTPLGPIDPFTCSSTSYCYNNYSTSCCSTPSCNQSPYLDEQGEEFCFEASAIRVKSEPELLPLFPLHSPIKPRN